MKKIKVGIIGLGVGYKHFEAYNFSKSSTVKSVCDFDKKKLFKIKKNYPKIIITQNSSDIIEDKEIDLVSIASYDGYHYEQIKQCIKNKKHIFVEKPFCLSLKQLNTIDILTKKFKINIESNYVLRTTDIFKKILNYTKYNKDLYFIDADYLWGRYKKLFGWRNKTKDFSLILGGAIHIIDLICWITNKYPITVSTLSNNIALNKSKFKKNSFFLIILKFKNGLIAKVSFNSNSNTKHFHQIKLYYKNSSIFHGPQGTDIFVNSKKIKTKIGKYPDKKNRKNLISDYVEKLYKTKFKYVYNKRLFKIMKICFAAIQSDKKNKLLKINYGRN